MYGISKWYVWRAQKGRNCVGMYVTNVCTCVVSEKRSASLMSCDVMSATGLERHVHDEACLDWACMTHGIMKSPSVSI